MLQVKKETGDFDLDENFANASDLVESLRYMQPFFNETYEAVSWVDEGYGVEAAFQEILTDDGICYTFNTLDQRNIYRHET